MEKLAIHGGPKAIPTPITLPNRYGEEELARLREVVESGRLMGPGGKVKEFEDAVAEAFGVKHVVMVTSGTAALHTALAALGVSEGNEVITTPMTDIRKRKYYPLTDAVPAFWRDTVYDPESCPNVDELQRTVLRLPVDPRYSDDDIARMIGAVRKVWQHFFGSGR